jgi:RNA polymerase sigma-70 factor (ECF subfamily)
MPKDLSFQNVLDGLRARDEGAAVQVFQRFANKLIALARSRLDTRLRQKVDPEDVAQSVFKSFFSRTAEGQFTLDNWDSLWGMLTVFTLRKCSQRAKFFHAARRNVHREVAPVAAPEDRGAAWEAPGHDPTPADAAILTELVESLMQGLAPGERPILMLNLQGYSVAEISAEIGRTERTVQRVLRRLRQRLEHHGADEEDADSPAAPPHPQPHA